MSQDKFYFFHSGYCSQWHKSKFKVDVDLTINDQKKTQSVEFCCCEQYMMAMKALLFNDLKSYEKIMNTSDPKTMKAIGRQIRGFKEAIWDQHKKQIVYKGNYAKFTQNDDLKSKLLTTGNRILAEASPNDSIWGIGMHAGDPNVYNQKKWGYNLLGQALMQVRDQIRKDTVKSKPTSESNVSDDLIMDL